MNHSRDPEKKKRVNNAPDARWSGWHNAAGYAQSRWRRRRGDTHIDAVVGRIRCHEPGEQTA